jgi:acyl-CoA reductase-like NAD-dependent aldehyde dehydrogenase
MSTLVEQQAMYVGGKWIRTDEHDTVRLPYDGTPVATVPRATPEHVRRAVQAAREGTLQMRKLANYERADLLLRIAELLRRDHNEFAHIISSESGKPIKEGNIEADRALNTLVAAAHVARDLHGEAVPMDFAPAGKDRMAITVREPVGVIAAITPFNFPLNLAMHKIAPAIAGGNAVVHKPASATPLSALRLARTMEEAGVPAGVYNVVTGGGSTIGNALIEDNGVAMVTFTGSAAVGAQIRSRAGLKKVTLELGNNSAVIIEPDADLALAGPRTVQGSFAHSGQVCISVQRVFVQESIADRYIDQLKAETEKLKIGHPYDESTYVSSLIDEQNAERIEEWIREAVLGGARVVTGGERTRTTVRPTILENVPESSRISCEEAFGPVLAIYRYTDLDDAVARTNATPYGLQAGIFTRDIQRAFHAARGLEFGGVMINDVPAYRADHMPYGGMKHSGIGREGPRYAIEEMTELKLICWRV